MKEFVLEFEGKKPNTTLVFNIFYDIPGNPLTII